MHGRRHVRNSPTLSPRLEQSLEVGRPSRRSVIGSESAATQGKNESEVKNRNQNSMYRDNSFPADQDRPTVPKVSERNLLAIYDDCLDLYHTRKITASNSFSCKLLDCLGQIVTNSSFDIENMQVIKMAGRTLEVGTKIYVCRVDHTYDLVMNLAEQIGTKGKKKGNVQCDLSPESVEEGNEELGENEVDENGDPICPDITKLSGMSVKSYVAPLDKIQMVEPDKSEYYAEEIKRITNLFNRMVETRQSIPDHELKFGMNDDSDFLESGTENENEELKKFQIELPNSLFDEVSFDLNFMAFAWFPKDKPYNYKVHDIWGFPTKDIQEDILGQLLEKDPIPQNDSTQSEYYFDPNGPGEYEGIGTNDLIDPMDMDLLDEHEIMESQLNFRHRTPTDLSHIRDLDGLDALRNQLRQVSFGVSSSWMIPNFVNGRSVSKPNTVNSRPRSRGKKEYEPITFMNLNWKDTSNCFLPGRGNEIDGKLNDGIMSTKNLIPFKLIPSKESPMDFGRHVHEDFDKTGMGSEALRVRSEEELFGYFLEPKRNVFPKLDNECVELIENAFAPVEIEAPFDHENDYMEDEFLRADGDDYCSQSQFSDEYNQNPTVAYECSSFVKIFPVSSDMACEIDDCEDFMGAIVDSEGVKFAKRPKPINMKNLKNVITRFLKDKLKLDDMNKPTMPDDQQTDYLTLIAEVFRRVDRKTSKLLTTSILVVALLHVVVELELLLQKLHDSPIENFCVMAPGVKTVRKPSVMASLPLLVTTLAGIEKKIIPQDENEDDGESEKENEAMDYENLEDEEKTI